MSTTPLREPLRFERVFLEKVWGGRALAWHGIALPDELAGSVARGTELRIGETWELVDREDVVSVVADGPHAGRSLHELVRTARVELLGDAAPTAAGRFPLLVKFIDAAENLSVQVHPDDAGVATPAARAAGHEAKTEAWVLLGAGDDALIWHGLAPGTTRAAFAAALAAPAGAELGSLLTAHRARAGQRYFVPGGTVHAIGAGVQLLEVQQNSDTTFRVWDWGRVGLDGAPRALHVDAALAAIRFGSPAPEPLAPDDPSEVTCPDFRLATRRVQSSWSATTGRAFRILAVTAGSGRLAFAGGEQDLAVGDVRLLPAALGAFTLTNATGDGQPLALVDLGPGTSAAATDPT